MSQDNNTNTIVDPSEQTQRIEMPAGTSVKPGPKHGKHAAGRIQNTAGQAQQVQQAQQVRQAQIAQSSPVQQAGNPIPDSGKVDRAKITRMAQLDVAEAVAMAGVAMESDEVADNASKEAYAAASRGDHAQAKAARAKERAARKTARKDHKAATKSAKRAYEAIRFSDPGKLGFMRFVQVGFGFHIIFTLLALILTSRDTVVYSSANVTDWLMAVLEGLAFWFFASRYKIGRPFVIAMSLLAIGIHIATSIYHGTFSISSTIFENLFYLFLIFYFLFSKRVKAVLVNDFSLRKPDVEKGQVAIDTRGWPFVRNLVIYFVVFSVLGHWMEAAMCQLIRLGLVQGEYDPSNTMLWRDWLYPYPMEGAAVVLIAVALYPLFVWLKKKISVRFLPYVISFLVNALTCSVIEFIGGIMFNADHQHWDYSDQFMNIMGQVCLQNALAFGAAASLITWVVYPMLARWFARISPNVMNIAFVVIALAGGILFSLYAIAPPEGLDLGERGQAAQDAAGNVLAEEQNQIAIVAASGVSAMIDVQSALDDATNISETDRANIQKHLDDINASYKEIFDIIEDNIDTELSTVSSSSAGASSASSSSPVESSAQESSAEVAASSSNLQEDVVSTSEGLANAV